MKVIIILEFIYLLIILYLYEKNKDYRRGEEYGSAKWGNKDELKKRNIGKNIKARNPKALIKKVMISKIITHST